MNKVCPLVVMFTIILAFGLPAGAAFQSPTGLATQSAGLHFAAQTKQPKQSTAKALALDRLYAALARAQNVAAIGDMSEVHAQLSRARTISKGLGSSYSALNADLAALQSRPVVTVNDMQSVLAKVGQQEQPRALLGLNAGVGSLSALQVPARVLIALLALWPVSLLGRVAGRSQYWRGLRLGLAVLLLPTLISGLCSLLGGLGAWLHVAPLTSVLAFPAWQNTWGWLPEQLCILAALGIISMNVWHLGVQFGVLGKPKKSATLTEIRSNSPWELD